MQATPYTSLLYAQPSFLSGASRIFDLGGNFDDYNSFITPAEADATALASDWAAIGQDMRNAMLEFARENNLPHTRRFLMDNESNLPAPAGEESEEPLKAAPRKQPPPEIDSAGAYSFGMTISKGPIPSAEELARYRMVLPDAPERILSMFEKQANHRMELEKSVVTSNIWMERLGLVCAFAIALYGLNCSYNLILSGKELAGSVFGLGNLAAIVGLFIYGRNAQSKERADKAQIQSNLKAAKNEQTQVSSKPPTRNKSNRPTRRK